MEELDGRIRRVHGDVRRNVEKRLRVVEDDLHAGLDEVVRRTLSRARGNGAVTDYAQLPEIIRDKNIIVGVIAVPASSAQRVADDLVRSGVKIIFNYSEALLDVPSDVQVHTSNPAVELLHALYFHLT